MAPRFCPAPHNGLIPTPLVMLSLPTDLEGGGLGPEHLPRTPESCITHLRAESSPLFTEAWESLRMEMFPAWSSGASLSPSPTPCLPVAPILRGAASARAEGAECWAQGGFAALRLPGCEFPGQSGVPAPPELARAQPSSLFVSLLFFPPAVGQVFN